MAARSMEGKMMPPRMMARLRLSSWRITPN
jgi:hypothetical protein